MSSQKPKAPILAGLDLGSTTVKFIIATVGPNGQIDVAGVGHAPNSGVKQGVVVNIEGTTDAIRKAKDEAELMAGAQATEVYVAVAGSHIKSFDSRGMVAIKNKEVTSADISRVLDAAKAVAVPGDRRVLHVIPREYKVDAQDGITDPVGMSGVRLEASVHIVTAAQAALNNTVKCIEKAGLKVSGLVLDTLASSYSVLSEDEKHLGVCLIEMGGGSCSSLYFVNGGVAQTSVIPVGGIHFTHDVALGLRTPQSAAEDLKKKHGSALSANIADSESIEVEGVGGRNARTIPRKDLVDVLEARAEETLALLANDIRLSGQMPMLGSGVVMTGGASQLDGLVEMGEFVFDIPVRRGRPGKVSGLTEVVKGGEAAVAVGLILYAFQERKERLLNYSNEIHIGESLDGIARKVRDFFGSMF